jgi:hypothetical protein
MWSYFDIPKFVGYINYCHDIISIGYGTYFTVVAMQKIKHQFLDFSYTDSAATDLSE